MDMVEAGVEVRRLIQTERLEKKLKNCFHVVLFFYQLKEIICKEGLGCNGIYKGH